MDSGPIIKIRILDRLFPAVVIGLLVLQVVDAYRGWMILLVGLGGAWSISYWWAIELSRNVRLVREMRYGYTQVGDRLEERFTLTNAGALPVIWAEVRDHSTFPGKLSSQVRAVPAKGKTRWQRSTVCARRGKFLLGPVTVCMGDPLGLYSVEIHYPETEFILVTPPILPFPAIQIASGGRSGDGRPRPKAPERTISVSALREYSEGDPWRWIHWPTTARKGSLFVREFDGTPASEWWIFLDHAREVQVGEGVNSTLEHGIILAASLAASALRSGIPVGLATGGDRPVWLPPSPGLAQRGEILQALALLEPGDQSLGLMLKKARGSLRAQISLIIITPDSSGEWIADLLPLLWRGIVPTVTLLDPQSFGADNPSGRAAAILTNLAVAHYQIDREFFDGPEARPGREGTWDWYVTATGRAVPRRQPAEQAWRRAL